ncbi:MAG TPA: hypothetical protein VGI63_07150 [Verrucomicrobiae bacterium]|jgi:hypothetical protein
MKILAWVASGVLIGLLTGILINGRYAVIVTTFSVDSSTTVPLVVRYDRWTGQTWFSTRFDELDRAALSKWIGPIENSSVK